MHSLTAVLTDIATPKLRFLAETDSSFKQLIPYVIVMHERTNQFFVTRRIGGDDRLLGKISLGLGGHVGPGESILVALFRELKEEIGLSRDNITEIYYDGFINTNESEIDRVHLGLICFIHVDRDDLVSLEPDKLEGFWATLPELHVMREQGLLESWSELALANVIERVGPKVEECDL